MPQRAGPLRLHAPMVRTIGAESRERVKKSTYDESDDFLIFCVRTISIDTTDIWAKTNGMQRSPSRETKGRRGRCTLDSKFKGLRFRS